ncbi:MAG: alpha/beta hydrolase, partial [Pseudomonadota bacterium]
MPTAQNGETELNWMAVGEGPALLLIHGGGGNAAVWWQQIEGLSDSFKVVAYDHRNFGRSSSQIGQFREEDFVGDALAVMDAAGISEATVVAQSLGGWTGLRLALAAPKRVTNLILSCSNAGVDYQPAVDSI